MTSFDLAGPAPTLLLDMPFGTDAGFTYPAVSGPTGAASLLAFHSSANDLLWYSIPENFWNANRLVGSWTASASHTQYEIIMTYGVGIWREVSNGYANVPFSVIDGMPGDLDGEGDVDGRDFLTWQRNTDVGDLASWQMNYGVGPLVSASVAVPEPGGLILVGVLVALLPARLRCASPRG